MLWFEKSSFHPQQPSLIDMASESDIKVSMATKTSMLLDADFVFNGSLGQSKIPTSNLLNTYTSV